MAEETLKTQPSQQQQPDAALLEQTKNQIRKLVAEIAELTDSDIQPAQFYQEYLTRAIASVAATGGALWMLDQRGALKLQHQIEFGLTGLLNGKTQTQPHDALLGALFQTGQGQIVAPGAAIEGVPNAGNPTNFALIIAPILVDKQIVGLVELLMDPKRRAASQKSTLRFVGDLADLAAQYLKNRQMRQMMSQQKLWNELEGYTHAIHSSLDLTETAYAVANDGKRLAGCDRLCVALKIGGRTMVEAVSGQEVVEQRSNLIRELTNLCKHVIKSGEDLVYTGDTEAFPPDIRDALEIYVDEAGSKSVVITLLHKPEHIEKDKETEKTPFGCLVAEQIGDELAVTDVQARTDVVARHASTALWNAQEHHKIFLRPVLKAIGSPWRLFRGRALLKVLAVLGAIGAIIGVMAFVPWELSIEGDGSLLPDQRSITFAPFPSRVIATHVDHGDKIESGTLLATLDSEELRKQYKDLQTTIDETREKMETLRRKINNERDPFQKAISEGERAELEIRNLGALTQLEIVTEQLDQLEVRAPHDGLVLTWEVKKNLLGRPVQQGDELIYVASLDGEWGLEVNVPDDDMAPVLAARSRLQKQIEAGEVPEDSTLEAIFILATDPEHRYPGYVRQIASTAETVEGKHVNRVTIGFTNAVRDQIIARSRTNEEDLRAGAEVRAQILCGDEKLAFVLFREVIDAFHESVLFRWPFLN